MILLLVNIFRRSVIQPICLPPTMMENDDGFQDVDCYNANPAHPMPHYSLKASLKVCPPDGKQRASFISTSRLSNKCLTNGLGPADPDSPCDSPCYTNKPLPASIKDPIEVGDFCIMLLINYPVGQRSYSKALQSVISRDNNNI